MSAFCSTCTPPLVDSDDNMSDYDALPDLEDSNMHDQESQQNEVDTRMVVPKDDQSNIIRNGLNSAERTWRTSMYSVCCNHVFISNLDHLFNGKHQRITIIHCPVRNRCSEMDPLMKTRMSILMERINQAYNQVPILALEMLHRNGSISQTTFDANGLLTLAPEAHDHHDAQSDTIQQA
jgi:hypothetical protein